MSRWVRHMAVWCVVWSIGALAIAWPGSPAWQYVVGFAILYAVGWISPPVWLAAYISVIVAEAMHEKHRVA